MRSCDDLRLAVGGNTEVENVDQLLQRMEAEAIGHFRFELPHNLGIIEGPVVPAGPVPEELSAQDAAKCRRYSIRQKMAWVVVQLAERVMGISISAKNYTDDQKVAIRELAIFIGPYIPQANGSPSNFTNFNAVSDHSSRMKLAMGEIISTLPSSPERDEFLKSTMLQRGHELYYGLDVEDPEHPDHPENPINKAKKACQSAKKQGAAAAGDKKRKATNDGQQPQKKVRSSSTTSTTNGSAQAEEALTAQDVAHAAGTEDGSHNITDPLLVYFSIDFPLGATPMTTSAISHLCGYFAMIDSIQVHREGIQVPTLSELEAERRGLGITQRNNFDTSQLGRILFAWGQRNGLVLELGYVVDDVHFLVPFHDEETETATRVWIHNDNAQQFADNMLNHWSGYRPNRPGGDVQDNANIDPTLQSPAADTASAPEDGATVSASATNSATTVDLQRFFDATRLHYPGANIISEEDFVQWVTAYLNL